MSYGSVIHRLFNRTAPGRRSRLWAVLLALALGQMALQVHGVEHALADGDPVCEVCVVSHSAALAGTGSALVPATEATAVALPPAPAVLTAAPRVAAARDPPIRTLS
ncbi:MAG TPA: hypothetical protein VJ985_10110 [Gammaproteobacteria bacterium]|nr:hypothetical protein [Gammaproteobacteria bacterium]